MDTYSIKKTVKTPEVTLDAGTGILKIVGRSISEHPFEFYTPIIAWIEDYKDVAQPKTVLEVELEYFNTSSFSVLLGLFKKLVDIKSDEHEVEINWKFEDGDESVLEAGEQYQTLIDVTFNLVEIAE